MSICVLAGGKATMLIASAFTLAWTHSIEKTRWEEDWRISPAGLELVEARVKGSGAGMEPPGDAVLADGWWTWTPTLPPQRKLVLAASGATASGWSMCGGGECVVVGDVSSEPVIVTSCEE